jgi:putative transposase
MNFAPGEYYHIYNRGTDKRLIFLDNIDRERFVSLLYLTNSGIPIHRSDHRVAALDAIFLIDKETTLVDIGAYCLMPNHFHMLVHEHSERGISMFMQKLLTAYTMYFNKRHSRSGALFEGTFRATHADTDNYLQYLFAYIHLNPIGTIDAGWKEKKITNKVEAKKFLETYPYSSFQDYAHPETPRRSSAILNPVAFPKYFERPRDFADYVDEWISGHDE